MEQSRQHQLIAGLAALALAIHVYLRLSGTPGEFHGIASRDIPLIVALLFGGLPLLYNLLLKLRRGEFNSDLLAGISIGTAIVLGEYLAGTLVVLMLAGGEALETYAIDSASSVLRALAKRLPSVAHRKQGEILEDIPLSTVALGDLLVVYPHENCPVDGVVSQGHGIMDESYLTGEPYRISKAVGSQVLSGAINGENALTIRAEKLPADSRYARIMQVMQAAEGERPRLRRLADQLGTYYTPLAVAIALAAWWLSGHADRFLAVLVVATPCPLIIAIPVAIIGAISLAARRGIIIRSPAVLETVNQCRTAIFDKTGTLTYGQPRLTDVFIAPGYQETEVLGLVVSLERYSKHPLSAALLEAARVRQLPFQDASEISERPGEGLRGCVGGRNLLISSRKKVIAARPHLAEQISASQAGMECIVLIDDQYAASLRFRDEPRADGPSFIQHLKPRHGFTRVLIVSGDRASEVDYLAQRVGIKEVYASQSPEQKLALVRKETALAPTLFMGDGINDAPALTAASVGIAFGQNSDITSEAAGAVILDTSLEKVDEFLHISQRLRRIALQSAVGGMTLSLLGMGFAAVGLLTPVMGALLQEVIDVLAVCNALRMAFPSKHLSDCLPPQ